MNLNHYAFLILRFPTLRSYIYESFKAHREEELWEMLMALDTEDYSHPRPSL